MKYLGLRAHTTSSDLDHGVLMEVRSLVTIASVPPLHICNVQCNELGKHMPAAYPRRLQQSIGRGVHCQHIPGEPWWHATCTHANEGIRHSEPICIRQPCVCKRQQTPRPSASTKLEATPQRHVSYQNDTPQEPHFLRSASNHKQQPLPSKIEAWRWGLGES